jgi:hypothetical protein
MHADASRNQRAKMHHITLIKIFKQTGKRFKLIFVVFPEDKQNLK